MNFEEIPLRMMQLGVDRTWLAQQCDYSPSTLANALAANGSNKTDKALRRIWEALDREEERQNKPPLIPALQNVVLRVDVEEFEDWSRAGLAHGQIVTDYCLSAIRAAYLADRARATPTPKNMAQTA